MLNEGIQSSANVQYVAKGADLRAFGVGYSGVLEVLSNILTNDYLYNNIRAKGGAYGQGIRFSRNGSVSCYSYRDPNLENTIAIYDQMADWLENLEMSDADLTDVIIGVMNRFNPVMTARARATGPSPAMSTAPAARTSSRRRRKRWPPAWTICAPTRQRCARPWQKTISACSAPRAA